MTSTIDATKLLSALLETARGRTSYSDDDLRLAAAPFISWALDIAGADPDLADILDIRNIERFVRTELPGYTPASRGNIRSRLLRLAELVLDPRELRPRLAAIPPANPLQPYRRWEIAEMLSWARSQSSSDRCRSAHVLLALGLGAGPSASELSEVRERDLVLDGGGLALTIQGARARTVHLLDRWASVLVEAVGSWDPDGETYLFRPRRTSSWANVVSTFVSQRYTGVRAQTQRMRATWIVEHLDAGTHVLTLTRAAGVDSLEALTRYLGFVSEPKPDAAVHQLRRPA